ncbi:MAG: LysR family transcriptional regulator [Clostridia bacterium]|nr:LysR family transcriptional regulator [Clostridia bacterium]
MNTQHLKYAIEVGKTGSITQAAENLYIGQPSLSKALKELEESLGIVIFKRTSKGAVPTAQGERFLVYARDVLRQVEKMESLWRADHLTAQMFHVSLPRVAYVQQAAQQVVSAMDAAGEMDVQLMRVSAICAIQHVADGVSELAVIRYPVRYERYFLDYMEEKKLCCDLIWEGEPSLLMSAEHALAKAEHIAPEELAAFPEVRYGDEAVPYLSGEELEERAEHRVFQVSDTLTLAGVLQAVPGSFSWCDDLQEETARQFGLTLRAMEGGGRMKDALVYPVGYAFREQDRSFIDAVYAARNKMMYAAAENA